jgi:hypothetical protein
MTALVGLVLATMLAADVPPKVAAPRMDAPKSGAPNMDAPKTGAPKMDAPRADAPHMDAPKTGAVAKGVGKIAPDVAKEMEGAIVAVNKALGLESWPAHGVKPCIDRGGQGILAKNVTPEDTRRCAAAAVEKGFSGLGRSYALAILMSADVGPITVIAVGAGDAAGFGAYSCDPTRQCKPMKIGAANKWGKRLEERVGKACGEAATIWLPAGQKLCP